MTDILDDLKAPSLFCGWLRKRAAHEIELLTKRATVLQRMVEERDAVINERDEKIEKLQVTVGDYRAVLEIRNKTIAERDKTIERISTRYNQSQKRFHAIQKALDGE